MQSHGNRENNGEFELGGEYMRRSCPNGHERGSEVMFQLQPAVGPESFWPCNKPRMDMHRVLREVMGSQGGMLRDRSHIYVAMWADRWPWRRDTRQVTTVVAGHSICCGQNVDGTNSEGGKCHVFSGDLRIPLYVLGISILHIILHSDDLIFA